MFTKCILEGDNVVNFLHNYTLTNCIVSADTLIKKPTAFLDNKGRVVTTGLFLSVDRKQASLLLLDEIREMLTQHLSSYAKFSRVTMTFTPFVQQELLEMTFCHAQGACSFPMPWLKKELSGCFTVNDLSLDLLGWIDRDKGCYLGQEIVSRLYFKQKVRKKFLACFSSPTHKHLSIFPEFLQAQEETLGVIDASILSSLEFVKTYQ